MAAESGLQGAAVSQGADEAVTATDARESATARLAHLDRLERLLLKQATGFDFFQAVRTIERLRPHLAAPGHFADPTQEAVRFTVNPSIAFPPQEIHQLDLEADGPARMSVNFFGLTGPQGVMPHPYTQLIAERRRAKDHAPADFFDLFHHRMLSLFYRAWEKNHFTVGYEKKRDDYVSDHLLDLIGEDVRRERDTGAVRDALPFYAGLLGPQARGAVALQQLLEDMFGVPVEVEQFIGSWYPLSERDQCELGDESDMSSQLGFGAVAGDEVWDQQTKVRLRIGPLSMDQYNDFLPTGSAHAKLRWMVRYFSRDAFDFEAQLVLDRDDVRGCLLGDDGESQPLGWSTWIRTNVFNRDADDAVVRL